MTTHINLLPDSAPGLIAHWPLQGTLLDTSGNGFTLTNSGLRPALFSTIPGTDAQGFDFKVFGAGDGRFLRRSNPTSTHIDPALALSGELTAQLISYQRTYPVPASAPGSFYHFLTQEPFNSYYSFMGGPLAPHGSNMVYLDAVTPYTEMAIPAANDSFNTTYVFWTFRRRLVSPGNYLAEVFKNGILYGPGVATTVGAGDPASSLWIGGTGVNAPNMDGILADIRILGVARSDTDIYQDFIFQSGTGPRPPLQAASGPSATIGAAATGHHFRYAPKAFGDQWRNPTS